MKYRKGPSGVVTHFNLNGRKRLPLRAGPMLALLSVTTACSQAGINQVGTRQPFPGTSSTTPIKVGKEANGPSLADGLVFSKDCLIQDRRTLSPKRLRSIGTEPFWSATISGRCIVYSQPTDPTGKRLLTRFFAAPDGGVWRGTLGANLFQLQVRSVASCSDGMSDKRYAMKVDLTVAGETREGCAEFIE